MTWIAALFVAISIFLTISFDGCTATHYHAFINPDRQSVPIKEGDLVRIYYKTSEKPSYGVIDNLGEDHLILELREDSGYVRVSFDEIYEIDLINVYVRVRRPE